MPYVEKLKELKEARKMTNQEIANLSNLPLATITRVFNGKTPNPTFETFAHIAIAMGASLDEIAGLKVPADEVPAVAAPIAATLDSYAELLKEKDDRIAELKAEKEKERKEKHAVAIALCTFLALVIVILIVDVLNGNFGYFRY